MADFEPPSFSLGLGLDLDLDSEPQGPESGPGADPSSSSSSLLLNSAKRASNLRTIREEDDDFETPVKCPDPQAPEPRRTLKRLRRGPSLSAQNVGPSKVWCSLDSEDDDVDDIEDFSSEEDHPTDDPPARFRTACSSSKFPLHGNGILTSQSASQVKDRKKKKVSAAPASTIMEKSSNQWVFPKIISSPLRRFQLIDSDSDDTPVNEGANEDANRVGSLSEGRQSGSRQRTASCEQRTRNESVGGYNTEDLWKDFCPVKTPTPALDEVCEEYFGSLRDTNAAENNKKSCYENYNFESNNKQQQEVGTLPPAHRYFFHEDARIRNLVRDRLPNFFPLHAGDNQAYEPANASVIDYMSQFIHGEGSKGASSTRKGSSTRSRKSVKKSNAEEITQRSDSWVNPKNSAGVTKDAGKRRVQAVGKSVGHWFTAGDGRRVYVNKSGQELTGQIAYRQYRKDNGAGFRKSKKKGVAKKKTASKKKK